MSSAVTQHLAALGTRCQRPLWALTPLAPFVLIVFLLACSAAALRRRLASSAPLTAVPAAEPTAAHESHRVGRFAARLPQPKHLLAGVAAISGGIIVSVGLAGGTYAMLNAQATTPAITISSGSLAVTVQAAGTTAAATTAIPAAAWSNMLPGDIVGQQVQVVNSSPAAVSLSFSLAATSAFEIRVAWGTCPATQLTTSALTTTPTTGSTIAAGYSSTMCVQAILPTSAPANVSGTAANLNLLIGVTQVSP